MLQGAGPDSLRAVLDSVFAASEYDWAERPALVSWLGRWWQWLIRTLQAFQDNNPGLFRWFVTAMIVILALVVLHAWWVMFRTTREATARDEAPSVKKPQPPRTAVWYHDRAEGLAHEGHFSEALMAAFQALVLDLDRRGLVRYHPSKTPREYVQEEALNSEDRQRLGMLVGTLYQYVFGHEPCGHLQYQTWLAQAADGWHAATA